MVFAHYFPPYPISIDNLDGVQDYYRVHYMDPAGENGKHKSYGGLLRDRPLPRQPRPGPDYRLADLEDEVRAAQNANLSGFSVDILVPRSSPNWVGGVPPLLLTAANNVSSSFKVMLMPDMSGELRALSADALAAEMAGYATAPAAYRLSDGRLVISPFLAEAHPPSWWSSFLSIMRTRYSIDVAFVPLFLSIDPNVNDFASISYGMSEWGGRNPSFNPTTMSAASPMGTAAKVRNLGKKWMAPVSVQDERPNGGMYDEAQNTQNLRNTWSNAINSNSDWVHLISWNDYSEGTQFAPSLKHGSTFLDISRFYIAQFQSGSAPAIVRDSLHLTHRTQPYDAKPSYPQTSLMQLRPGSAPARNTAEALVFLTAPAVVDVTVGSQTTSCSLPAGMQICTANIVAAGNVSASVKRSGNTVITLASPYPYVNNPWTQDLQYIAVSSGVAGGIGSAPQPVTSTPVQSTMTPPRTTTTTPIPPTTTIVITTPPRTTTTAPPTTTIATTPPRTTTTTTTTRPPHPWCALYSFFC